MDTNLINNSSHAVGYNSEIRSKFDVFLVEEFEWQFDHEEHIENVWCKVKGRILPTSKEILTLRTKKNKQAWMTDDIFRKMD